MKRGIPAETDWFRLWTATKWLSMVLMPHAVTAHLGGSFFSFHLHTHESSSSAVWASTQLFKYERLAKTRRSSLVMVLSFYFVFILSFWIYLRLCKMHGVFLCARRFITSYGYTVDAFSKWALTRNECFPIMRYMMDLFQTYEQHSVFSVCTVFCLNIPAGTHCCMDPSESIW